jgi:hypothetical protein
MPTVVAIIYDAPFSDSTQKYTIEANFVALRAGRPAPRHGAAVDSARLRFQPASAAMVPAFREWTFLMCDTPDRPDQRLPDPCRLDRLADRELAAGKVRVAEWLAWRAAELRAEAVR